MLRSALDKFGRLTHVTEAKKTEKYYCPVCRCLMELRIMYGEWFFVVAPGSAHDHKNGRSSSSRIPDIWLTPEVELEHGLLTKPAGKRKVKGEGEKGDDDTQLLVKNNKVGYSVVPIKYLSDFWKEGIYTWPADTMLNGYMLTDVFVSRKNAAVLMQCNDPLEFRIVEVSFSRIEKNNTLRFALYSVSEEGKYIRYFDLYVEDEEEYQILKDEVSRTRNTHYLLAGKWERCDCEIGNGGEWKIVGVQKTKFTSDNQLYRCGRR